MFLDAVLGDAQLRCDFFILQAQRNEPGDLQLPGGEKPLPLDGSIELLFSNLLKVWRIVFLYKLAMGSLQILLCSCRCEIRCGSLPQPSAA
jgi:hypothetical protein